MPRSTPHPARRAFMPWPGSRGAAFTMPDRTPVAATRHGTKSDFGRSMAIGRLKLSHSGRSAAFRDAT